MRKKSLACRNVLQAMILILAAFKAHAQLGIPPLVSALPEEAPASLFSTAIGDTDVELFVQGFWEASIQSLGTIYFGGPAAAAFNATPFLFTQRPDLYLLLVFRRQWWLEASVADDIERATWAIGYSGDDDDFLKFARLGNTGIFMPDYPYITFGAPSGAFGAVVSGRDESKGTAFDAMIRWDGLTWRSRSFNGLAESVETIVRPGDQLRGRRFVLPAEGLSSIALYDHTSSGKRSLQADEYSASLSMGFVELKAEPRGVLSAVYTVGADQPVEIGLYQKAGTEVAGAILPENIEPSLEARNLYALSDSPSRRELFVRNLSTGQTDLGFEVREAGPGLIEVVRAGTAGPRPPDPIGSWHDDDYRRPFSVAAVGPAGQDWIYDDMIEDDQEPRYPPTEGYAIIARSIETVDAIVLGKEAVPGTVTVFRDGVQSEAYEFDSANGALELFPPPRSGESILVRYAVTSSDRNDGALVYAAGTRFPWLGLDWALALGGRWSLPGVAYAAGGELKPAWTGLALSLERREADVGFGAKAMAKYARASANDLYRLAGMEDAPDYSAPFRPLGDTLTLDGFEVTTIADTGLATAFPEILGKIHARNEVNRVLSIKAEDLTSGDIELLRYIEPAPLASFGRLSFFIKTEGLVGPSEEVLLSVQLGSGPGGAGGLAVQLPVHELPAGWHKIEVDLNPVLAAVRILAPDGQSLELSPPPSATFAAVTTVGEIRVIIEGLNQGTVFIDEIVLDEAEDGLSAILSLDFSLGASTAARPPYLHVDLTGVVDDEFSMGGSVRAGWFLGPSEWAVSLAPTWSGSYSATAFGYTLAVPSRVSATRFVDQYSQNIEAGSFTRNLSGVLGVDKLQLGLEAASSETGTRFAQIWKGTAGWGTLAKFGVDLALTAPDSALDDSDPAEIWLRSWQLILPAMEAASTTRRMNLNLSFIESRLALDYRHDYAAPGTIATNAGARGRLPFAIGALGFEPYLERRYMLTESGASLDFSEDFVMATDRAVSMYTVFKTLPLLDLVVDETGNRFVASLAGSDSASYSTRAGFSARRPIGYGLSDLYVPNTMEFSWTRTFESKLESQVEYHDFMIKATTAAVNLFGYGGAKPLIEIVAYDEYSSDIESSIRYLPSDGALLPTLAAKHAVSVETRQGSTVAAASRFSWKRTRAGSQIRESLSLSLGKKPDRSWLGDLVSPFFTRRATGTERVSGEDVDSSVSRWFDSILVDAAVLRDSYDASVEFSAQELSGSSALKAAITYATRMIIPGSLSVGFRSSINQSIQFKSEGWVWGFGYELAVEGRVSF